MPGSFMLAGDLDPVIKALARCVAIRQARPLSEPQQDARQGPGDGVSV
jgi:hypothetical protein